MTERGKFITLYGINNIGKSTHAQMIVDRLNASGKKAVHIKYPVYELEPTGTFLNKTLRGGEQKIGEDELQLWFILNRYQFQPELERMLNEGVTVIAEDYIGTGIAWGTTKGLETEWLENANKMLKHSDHSILMVGKRYLDAKEDQHLHEQNDDLMRKCEEVHLMLAEKYGWEIFNMSEKLDDTHEDLWMLFSSLI